MQGFGKGQFSYSRAEIQQSERFWSGSVLVPLLVRFALPDQKILMDQSPADM